MGQGIMFSKAKILKVLSVKDMNQELYKSKAFSRQFSPQPYNYYDYIDAWYNTFYLWHFQHSWFFWFKKGISLKFPKWFLMWFNNIGPTVNLLPQQVKDNCEYVNEITTFVQGYRFISFVASQGLA